MMIGLPGSEGVFPVFALMEREVGFEGFAEFAAEGYKLGGTTQIVLVTVLLPVLGTRCGLDRLRGFAFCRYRSSA